MLRRYDAVLSPLTLGSVTVRNRVVVTAHLTGFAEQGAVTPRLVDHLVARARGGAGLLVTEAGTVHPTYRPAGIRYYQDGAVDGLAGLAEAVHREGALIIGQVNHGGAAAPPLPDQRPALSPSDNDGINGAPARAMTRTEIAEIRAAFVHAARVLAEAGTDGCEVHGAHHYLINHFLSPLYNRRTDEYGGGLENRLRLVAEILEEIRASTRPDFLLGIRLGADIGPGGLDGERMLEIGSALRDRNLIDYVSLSAGGRTPESFPLMTGGMERPAGYELEWNEKPARGLSCPTLVTGRYRTLAEAEEAIASGVADLVGMTRAHIADPEIVVKSVGGRADRVRPCIGCNECVRSIITEGSLRCAVNPALPSGHGTDAVPRAVRSRNVVVIGGGPAGMEAARVAALAGHRVTLFERSGELGGLARRAARVMPDAGGMAEAVAWTERELHRLGVRVRLGRVADASAVMTRSPELVIAATGSAARRDGRQTARPGFVPAGAGSSVLASRDVIALDPSEAGAETVVVDEIGDYEAIGVAEYIVASGGRVTFVTPFTAVGLPLEFSGRPSSALARLRATGRFEVVPLAMATDLTRGAVVVEDLLGHTARTIPAERVVMVTRAAPHRPPWLEDLGVPFEVVGDALLPRSFRAAVLEGYRAAMAIGEGSA